MLGSITCGLKEAIWCSTGPSEYRHPVVSSSASTQRLPICSKLSSHSWLTQSCKSSTNAGSRTGQAKLKRWRRWRAAGGDPLCRLRRGRCRRSSRMATGAFDRVRSVRSTHPGSRASRTRRQVWRHSSTHPEPWLPSSPGV